MAEFSRESIKNRVQARVAQDDPDLAAPRTAGAPTRDSIRERVAQRFTQGDIPEGGERGGIGTIEARAPSFSESYAAGTDQFRSNVDYTQALVYDLIGDEESRDQLIAQAEQRDEISAGLMAGGESFQSFLEDPSLGGGLQYAKQTLGQLAPMALESAAGALAGTLVAPGAGTVAGGTWGSASRILLQNAAKQQVLKELQDQSTDAAQNQVLSAALRSQAARRGAYVGATATELRQGTGETYRETVEAGDPSPLTALATAAPFAAIGFLPDKMIIDSLATAVRNSDPTTRSAMKEMLTQVSAQVGSQAASEAGQEELLIQLHDVLSADDYAGSDEAMNRRIEAAAAGAVGGGAMGGITGAGTLALNRQVAEASVGRGDEIPKTPEQLAFEGELENALEGELVDNLPATRDMRDDVEIVPESQRDIDAQFTAMLGEQSAKQAVEVTEGSPMPSGYREGMEGVIRVETPTGFLLTTDESIAQDVQQNEGSSESVARALGYAAVREEGMTQAVIARNEAGDVVHSELIAVDETPESAMERARQFAPNVELANVMDVLGERTERVREEGRNPELEAVDRRLRKATEEMQRLERSMELLQQARRMPEHAERLDRINKRIPQITDELARVQQRVQQNQRMKQDLEARQRQSTDLRQRAEQKDQQIMNAMRRSTNDRPEVSGGIEVINTNTGEVQTLPREVYDEVAMEIRSENQGERFGMTDDELSEFIAAEFESRGYLLDQTDTRPVTVQNVQRDEVRGKVIPEPNLDPSSPRAYREPHRNMNAREQIMARQHRLGPMTEATVIDGVRVPVSAMRQLRKFRQMYPEDNWSMVSWTNDRSERVYQLKRERTYSERSDDETIRRDVEGTDSTALQMTRERAFDADPLTVTPDPSISTTARQRVLGVTEQARWQHDLRQPPVEFSLRMTDPDGRQGFYDPKTVARAGMDAIQDMVANRSVRESERRQMGLLAALGILKESGFHIDANTIPLWADAANARRNRHNIPEKYRVASDWDALDPTDRIEFLQEHGVSEIDIGTVDQPDIRDLGDLMPGETLDITVDHLPQAVLEFIPDFKFQRYGNEQPEWMQRQSITNRDIRVPKTLARMGLGVQIDPRINPVLRMMVAQAKNEAQLTGDMYVLTGATTREMRRNLPRHVRRAIETDPSLVPLFTQKTPERLRGRTVILENGDSIVWVNENLSGEIQSLTIAHEMGHVAFQQHQQALMSDPKRAERLQADFRKAQAEGHVKQYNDSQLGFEEWFADRFAAWVHNRRPVDDSGVVRNGQFRKLYKQLRMVARELRVTAGRLAAAGQTALYARIRPNQAVNSFMDGIARTAPKERALNRMRRDYIDRALRNVRRTMTTVPIPPDEMQQQLDDMGYLAELEAEMRQVQAEIDANTYGDDIRPSMEVRLDGNDPIANAQKERLEGHTITGIAGPFKFDLMSNDMRGRRRDPKPRIDFDEDLQPRPDPRPREKFEVPPTEGQPDPAPSETFEREPAAGGGGAGQGTPPGGNPPPPGDGPGPLGGGPDPLWDAIGGHAQRWATTETFQNVLRWINENLGPVMQRGFKALRNLTFTADARLRRLGPQGRRIANWFLDDTYDRNLSGDRGYFNAVEMELTRFMSEVEGLLPDDPAIAEAALREAQSGTPTAQLSREAKRIRRFLKRFYTGYLSQHTEGIRMRNDYFPRVYDMSEIMARSDQFSQLLIDAGYPPAEAARIISSMMEGESSVELSTDDQQGSGPGMSARLNRLLTELDDSVLQQNGFLVEPRAALMQYLRSAVKRAEYEKRFAGEFSLEEVYQDMLRRRQEGRWVDPEYFSTIEGRYNNTRDPSQVMLRDPSARLKRELARMNPEQRGEAEKIIQGYMGRDNTLFGLQMTPQVARTVSAIGGAMYMATLGLSAISQITDFGAIVMRTRGSDGLGMLHRAIMQVPADERLALARAVGSISEQANLDALRMTYGNDFMTPGMRKMTDTFFKVIGLEQITNFSRSVATSMGAEFLSIHAIKAGAGDPRSQRYLDELRVTPQQVFAWESNGRRLEGDAGHAVREALFQFTDESILRPNAAMRPGWASNPWFTLAWQLKSFAYGFYKVVLRGMANEIRQRNREGAGISAQMAPLILTGAVMMPLAFSTMVIRDVAKEGLNSVFDDDEYEWNSSRNRSSADWMLELSDRSGLLGPWALVNSAYNTYQWGDNPLLTLAGPAAEKGGHLAKGEFAQVANDMIPVAGLVR